MGRLHTTVGAGLLLLAVTSCATPQPQVGFGGQPPAPSASGPVRAKPEQERALVPPTTVRDLTSQGAHPSKVWTQDGGSVVVTNGQEGGCSKVHAEVADQNAQQVKLALVEQTPDPPKICTMDLRYPPVAAQLDAPLNGRQVVLEHRELKVPR